MSIHLGALSLISGGPSECLTLEVKLEFGGSLDLEINIFGLVHKTKTKQSRSVMSDSLRPHGL